jgi:uncharacterized membrane protein YoaT (DUF817 family)
MGAKRYKETIPVALFTFFVVGCVFEIVAVHFGYWARCDAALSRRQMTPLQVRVSRNSLLLLSGVHSACNGAYCGEKDS